MDGIPYRLNSIYLGYFNSRDLWGDWMTSTMMITEKQFEAQIKDLALMFGWRYYHTWRSFHSPKGFPDCVLVKSHRLIFAELKSEKGKPTLEQEEWLSGLREVKGIEVYLWKPSGFDEIVEILESLYPVTIEEV